MVDLGTKYMIIKSLSNLTAEITADILFHDLILPFGIQDILSLDKLTAHKSKSS